MIEIDSGNFHSWKKDEVTKEVFRLLQEVRDQINLELTNTEVLLNEKAQQIIPRLIGQREGIDLILQIQFEDLQKEKQNEDQEIEGSGA